LGSSKIKILIEKILDSVSKKKWKKNQKFQAPKNPTRRYQGILCEIGFLGCVSAVGRNPFLRGKVVYSFRGIDAGSPAVVNVAAGPAALRLFRPMGVKVGLLHTALCA